MIGNRTGVFVVACLAWVTSVTADPLQECTSIVSSLERLACFDRLAGTPAMTEPASVIERPRDPQSTPEIVRLLQANEARRPAEDSRFLMSVAPESERADQEQVVISAPALGSHSPRPYLMISCLSNISRLQFIMGEEVKSNTVQIRLMVDERAGSVKRTWQVLPPGSIIDAGRGLPGIELIRQLGGGMRLRVESDYDKLDGLLFDVTGLEALIAKERQACHW